MKTFLQILSLILLITLGGCSTIMTGTSQPISINSNIQKAKVYIDGAYAGETPLMLDSLSTKKDHTIRIEAEGYSPVTEIVKRSASGWVWGNLFLGGPIGLVIDIATGGLYVFEKDNVNASLTKIESLNNSK